MNLTEPLSIVHCSIKYCGVKNLNIPFSLSVQVVAFVLTFILTLLTGPILIPILRRLRFGQTVRDDGPATHLKKTGTPTIGGLIFVIPIIIVTLLFFRYYPRLLPILLVTLGSGAVGFVDDFIKVVKKRKDGLYAGQKTLGLLLVGVPFAFYVQFLTEAGEGIVIPFIGLIVPAWAYVLFIIGFMYFTTNAVNLTDGLDGLLSGITLIVMVFFTIIAMTRNEWDYLKLYSAMIAGGCLGFLCFNAHPARVFMGDTGSLALGGAVSATAVLMKMPLLIVLVGIIYMVEAFSVIIQVASFKLRGKRVFRMAPIHHHFELSGWKETRVVAVFWLITAVACFLGLVILQFKFI
jgi:phospho-N-acetylmuramoyl-pentapeptide-transferase